MFEAVKTFLVNFIGSPFGSVLLFVGVYLLLQMVILPKLGIST